MGVETTTSDAHRSRVNSPTGEYQITKQGEYVLQ
jgi:hypothetical protein